jgi:hypothetical protein
MRMGFSLTMALVTVTVVGCTRVSVSTDYDHAMDFGALHTYAWRPGEQPQTGDPRFDGPFLDKCIRTAVDRGLASKGYRPAAAGTTPDFLVGYYAAVRYQTSVQTMHTWYGPNVSGWGGWPETYAHHYEEGTLLIDVIDPGTMKLLWRGRGSGVVDPRASPTKREKRIDEAVDRILAEFPPG